MLAVEEIVSLFLIRQKKSLFAFWTILDILLFKASFRYFVNCSDMTRYMEFSNHVLPRRLRFVLRRVSADFLYTYLLQNMKFYVTKSRSRKYISALASRRESFGTDENSHAPGISVASKIFGARMRPPCHLSKHFSNASTSEIREQHLYSPRRGIPSSHESSAGKYVFRIRVSLQCVAPVCNTRGHAKEIACYSSI